AASSPKDRLAGLCSYGCTVYATPALASIASAGVPLPFTGKSLGIEGGKITRRAGRRRCTATMVEMTAKQPSLPRASRPRGYVPPRTRNSDPLARACCNRRCHVEPDDDDDASAI